VLLERLVNSSDEIVQVKRVRNNGIPLPPHDLWDRGVPLNPSANDIARLADQGRLSIQDIEPSGSGIYLVSQRIAERHRNDVQFGGPVARSSSGEISLVIYSNPLSFAHEIFGHAFLYILGANGGHNKSVQPEHQVPTPFEGIPYVGPTNGFIDGIASHKGFLVGSPTEHVSTEFVDAEYLGFIRHFRNHASNSGGSTQELRIAVEHLTRLSLQYLVMRQINVGTPAYRALWTSSQRAAPKLSDFLIGTLVQYFCNIRSIQGAQTELRRILQRLGRLTVEIWFYDEQNRLRRRRDPYFPSQLTQDLDAAIASYGPCR
jgi:hypothetical protein